MTDHLFPAGQPIADYQEPEATEADFNEHWGALVEARRASPELTWKAVRAAMDAAKTTAENSAGGPAGCSAFVDRTLRNLGDKDMTWDGAAKALQGLIDQVKNFKSIKSQDAPDFTRNLRIKIVQSALDALNHEMKASQELGGRY